MSHKDLAKKRAKEGVCIICGKADERIARGLCVTHYNRWDKQRKRLPQDKRDEYDQRLIDEGYLLPSRRGRKPVTEDVFADIANEVLGLPTPETAEHDAKKDERKPPEEAAAEKLEEAKKAQEEPEKKREKPKQGGRTQAKREQ